MLSEEQILKLQKKNNYHYNLEYVDGTECMAMYYRLSGNKWNRHTKYCKNGGFKNNINQWLRILVDAEDFDKINGWGVSVNLLHLYNSGCNRLPHIQINTNKVINEKQVTKTMHKHILNTSKDFYVDHINHNIFDNRKCNLRLVTRSESSLNINNSMSNSKTGIRGVSVKTEKKGYQYYYAILQLNKKRVFQKRFPFTPQGLKDAEQAVIEARQKYFSHSEMDKQAV